MYVVRGTKKFRDRVREPRGVCSVDPTTQLGDWYATVLFWKPQIALFVDERTRLPVLFPLAPAATVIERFPDALAVVLARLGVERSFIDAELAEMTTYQLAPTANRSVLGTMNDFAFMASVRRAERHLDLTDVSAWLAETPCGPLRTTHGSPDREVAAVLTRRAT